MPGPPFLFGRPRALTRPVGTPNPSRAATTFPCSAERSRPGRPGSSMEAALAWIYLVLAGLFEMGWPVGLKLAQSPGTRLAGIAMAIAFLAISGTLLWLAQRQIPIGTAYAVWTGIGAAGTFALGVLVYGDPSSIARYVGVAMIVGGVITLKLAA